MALILSLLRFVLLLLVDVVLSVGKSFLLYIPFVFLDAVLLFLMDDDDDDDGFLVCTISILDEVIISTFSSVSLSSSTASLK